MGGKSTKVMAKVFELRYPLRTTMTFLPLKLFVNLSCQLVQEKRKITGLMVIGLALQCTLATAAVVMNTDFTKVPTTAEPMPIRSNPTQYDSQQLTAVMAAATTGDALAQTKLAIHYLQGDGVEKNLFSAFAWFKKAAAQNQPTAMVNLAQMYNGYYATDDLAVTQSGIGGSGLDVYDPSKAFELNYQLANDYKMPIVFSSLADHYYDGIGTPQNWSKAWYWFKQAAKTGDSYAKYRLATMYLEGEVGGQYADVQQALDWLVAAANEGVVDAQYHLGQTLLSGYVVKQDSLSATYWLKQAAEQGHGEAQYALVDLLYFGKGIAPRPKEAQALMQKYAAQ